jgi:hypothetical protein
MERNVTCGTVQKPYYNVLKITKNLSTDSRHIILPNPSSRTIAMGLTRPLTDISTRNFPVGNARPARKADNFTAICEPIV